MSVEQRPAMHRGVAMIDVRLMKFVLVADVNLGTRAQQRMVSNSIEPNGGREEAFGANPITNQSVSSWSNN